MYPNKEGYPIIPLSISVLAGVLKRDGHTVDVFDITFMLTDRLDHNAREKTGVVKKVDVEKYWGEAKKQDIREEFKKKIGAFNPDLIAFSIVENNYACARELLKVAKQITNSPTIVGGIFPTVAPEFFIQDDNVDIICIGEGERALLELVHRLEHAKDITTIQNCIVKCNGTITKNDVGPFYDWEPFAYQDWGIFDRRHLLKPFIGKMWKTGFFEMSRGCPFDCFYCANHIYQDMFKSLGPYHREKSLEYVFREIEHMKKAYSLELVFFNDENFLMMEKKRFEAFCAQMKERINLPFFIQTRAESLCDEEKVKMLSEAGCITVGIGVESGSQRIRRETLNKNTPDHVYVKAFANCKKYTIRTTAYVMIGLPFETEDDIEETAEFCKKIEAQSIAISIFAPYHGTRLYDICVKNNFVEDKYYENISVNDSTILNMPQLSRERLEGLYYKFNDLVYSVS